MADKKRIKLEDIDPDVAAAAKPAPVTMEETITLEPVAEAGSVWAENAFIVTPDIARRMVFTGEFRVQNRHEVVVFLGADEQPVFALDLAAISVAPKGSLYVDNNINIPLDFLVNFEVKEESDQAGFRQAVKKAD